MAQGKTKHVQVRLTDEESEFLFRLKEDYGLSYSDLILHALAYVDEKRPTFIEKKIVKTLIKPQPKTFALASMTA